VSPTIAPARAADPEIEGDEEPRAADVLGSVSGHFSVFDTPYRISSMWEGDFIERVAPGSFTKTLAERGSQIVSNFDHGFDPQIGDKVLGPFTTLSEDSTGGAYAFDLLDTSYNRDLMPALKRGLYGSSFRFQVLKDDWDMEPKRSADNPDGVPERTIRETRVYELGPVTYPANPAATAGMRCGTDSFYEALRNRDPEQVDALRSRVHDFRTAAQPAASGTGAPAAAAQQADEPVNHSGGLSHAQRRVALFPYLRSAR
jgi:HK97 family phage prohead protease